MGLRINTNVSALSALRNVGLTDSQQQRSLQRLSSGLRINKAGDDPPGLVISEQFRAQIGSLDQALRNTQFASSLVATSEAALGEVSNLLIDLRASIISGLNSTGDPALLALEQDSIDEAVSAINRIANTTRFGETKLLNGGAAFRTSSVSALITNLSLRSVFFGTGESTNTFTLTVDRVGSHAGLAISLGTSGTGTIRVTGNLGSHDIFITASTDLSGAINSVREFTGVYASGGRASSQGLGSDERVSIEVVSGTTAYDGATGTSFGVDAAVTLAGTPTTADGQTIRLNGTTLRGELTLSTGLVAGASLSFSVLRSGVNFQLGPDGTGHDSIRIGIDSFESGKLGTPAVPLGGGATGDLGGFLSSITSGGPNALATDPTNALRIVDAALDQVNVQRGFLGAVDQQNLQPNVRSLGVAIENLTASESQIRDLNFAEEVAEFTRSQVLFAAGISTLASANLVPQTVLSLLT